VASPVYSAQFVLYSSSAPNFDYEVPEGYTAVIRQLSGAQDIGGWVAYCQIGNSIDAPGVTIWIAEQAGTVNYVATEGRWVVPGGGLIQTGFSEIGPNPFLYVGGYLLPNSYSR